MKVGKPIRIDMCKCNTTNMEHDLQALPPPPPSKVTTCLNYRFVRKDHCCWEADAVHIFALHMKYTEK